MTPSELLSITEPLSLDIEENLRTASGYYLKAIGFVTINTDIQEYTNLTKRLGNAQNQLGIHYMNTARFTKAAWHFQLAVDTFKQIKDPPNIALIYCNIGRLMKVYAQNERIGLSNSSPTSPSAPSALPASVVSGSDDPMSEQELSHYKKAEGFYINAKEAIKERKLSPGIWDAVHSQLASTYLIMGLRMTAGQGPGQLTQECARDAAEYLLRALKISDSMKDSYQAGIAHLHIASLYGKMIRKVENESERRSKIKVAMLHFEKAQLEFTQEKYPKEFLCVKYELAVMYEQMPSSTNSNRIEHLFKALNSLLEIGYLLSHLTSSSHHHQPSIPQASIALFNSFKEQNGILTKTNESGQVKTKVEEIIKQLLKIISPPPSSSSTSTSPSTSTSSASSSYSQHLLFLKPLYKDVLSAQSVEGFGKVLNAAKPNLEKLL